MKQYKSTSRWHSLRLPCVLAASLASLTSSYADTYSDVVKADGPTAYYRMEDAAGSTSLTDEIGNNPGEWIYNYDDMGTPLSPVLEDPGIDVNCVTLHPGSASAGYGEIPWSEAINPTSAYTVEFWVRPISAPAEGYNTPIASAGPNSSGWLVAQYKNAWVWCQKFGGDWLQVNMDTTMKWQHLAATYDGTIVRFYVNGVEGYTKTLSDYVGNTGSSLVIGGIATDSINFDGNIDEIAIYDKALSVDRIVAHYELGTNSFRVADTAPSILTQPGDSSFYVGRTATFSVVADGTAPLSYQWYKDSTAIAEATNSTYSFPCALADNGSAYKVVITNAFGSITSSAATLTAATDLLIDVTPVSVTRYVGSKAAFYVGAAGALPFTYQWYKGSTAIANATNATLWLNKLAATDDGASYYVKVGNGFFTTNLEPVTLTVLARPTTVDVSKGYAKYVIADDPVAYWRLDEVAGSTTVIDAVGSFDGTYDDASGAGIFTYEVPTGITNETDTALSVSQKARVVVPWAVELNPHGPFSVEGWLKPASLSTSSSDYRTAISSESDGNDPLNPTGWLLYQTADNQWAWILYDHNWVGTYWLQAKNVNLVAGEWYYVALTHDGLNANIYINGNLEASTPTENFHPARTGGVNFGWRTLPSYEAFDGTIDEVAFYNKELSAAQVKAHYTQSAVATAPSSISIARSGTSVTLTWTSGVLQECATVNGTYTDVASATSPYTATANTGTMFYRLKGQ